jgi:hypothetical protein
MIVSLSASRDQFLVRAGSLSQLLENLKPAPLRNLLIQLGLEKGKIKDFGPLKLLATLCQLATVAVEHGHALPSDADSAVRLGAPELRIAAPDAQDRHLDRA